MKVWIKKLHPIVAAKKRTIFRNWRGLFFCACYIRCWIVSLFGEINACCRSYKVPSRELIWISSTNYKPQASLHQQQLNVLFSYYKSPSKLLPSLSHPDRFIILPNQFILGQTIVMEKLYYPFSKRPLLCSSTRSTYSPFFVMTSEIEFYRKPNFC